MFDDQIKHMVSRFLTWRLPEDFNPDAGINFKPDFNEHTAHPMKHEPTGTNLFDATQAEAMVRYLLDGLPAAPQSDLNALIAEAEKLAVTGPFDQLVIRNPELHEFLGKLRACVRRGARPQSDQPAQGEYPAHWPREIRDACQDAAQQSPEVRSFFARTIKYLSDEVLKLQMEAAPASQPVADARELAEKIFNLFQEEELCPCLSCRAEDGPTLAALLESFRAGREAK